MTNKILCGDAGSAFLKVFTPLAQFNTSIEKSKDTCQHDPYVSLRTYCEMKLDQIQVYPVIVDNYGTFGSTLNGGLTKTRDFISYSLSFTGRSWNTTPLATSLMLKTATDALKSRISDINGSLPDNTDEIFSLIWEINQIKSTLKQCRATVCHVFKTMLDPSSKQYETGTTLVGGMIKAQYDELNVMIDQLRQLKKDIQTKLINLEPKLEIENEKSQTKLINLEPKLEIENEKTPIVPRNLEFKSESDASAWFKRQMCQYRKKLQDNNWTGDKCYKDVMALAKNTVTVPQSFYKFAKSLDVAIKDPMLSCEFFQEFYVRCINEKLLIQSNEPINNFQELLCQLYKDKSPRDNYQVVFSALLNEDGNGPFGLKHESKIINEIIRSDFFAMFDPEHEVL